MIIRKNLEITRMLNGKTSLWFTIPKSWPPTIRFRPSVVQPFIKSLLLNYTSVDFTRHARLPIGFNAASGFRVHFVTLSAYAECGSNWDRSAAFKTKKFFVACRCGRRIDNARCLRSTIRNAWPNRVVLLTYRETFETASNPAPLLARALKTIRSYSARVVL